MINCANLGNVLKPPGFPGSPSLLAEISRLLGSIVAEFFEESMA
jgi:hypothetical protein